jgi:hypothetical protein
VALCPLQIRSEGGSMLYESVQNPSMYADNVHFDDDDINNNIITVIILLTINCECSAMTVVINI